MAPEDSCRRKRSEGEVCGKPVPDARGTHVVVNELSLLAMLCPECVTDLLLTFLSEAPSTPWRSRPPVVTSGGNAWSTSDVRSGLKLSGHGALVGSGGPLSMQALDMWDELESEHGPAQLALWVRTGQAFSPDDTAKIIERVARNREAGG